MSTPTPSPTWSSETRTWVSLLLFAHLFALGVAVTSYTRPSLLQQRLHQVFEPYLRSLHLTALPASYPFARFHLTHAGQTDIDYSIEVVPEAAGADGTITVPESGLRPLIRYRRYQALANTAGTLASGELGDLAESILPKTIAGTLLHDAGDDGGMVRIRALGLPDFDDTASLAAIARAARENRSTIYEAQVIISGNSVELLKTPGSTLETAPIAPGARRPAAQPVPGGATP